MTVISPPDAAAASGRGAATPAPHPDRGPGHDVPVRAPGLELLGELPGSGYRQPPGLARRADGQTCQLTRLLYLILEAADGRRDNAEIAAVVSAKIARLVTADNVAMLTETKLRPLGLLAGTDGSAPPTRAANPLLALRFRLVVSNPRVTRRITAPFAFLFRPLVVAAVLAAFLLSSWWVLFDKGLGSAAHQAFAAPGLLLLVFAVTVVSAGFHEFGHAAACRYGGASPGAMGVGLYLVWPAFYTNVDDSYRLGRAGRIRVDLGGLYFNAIVAVVMFAAWGLTRWDALLLIIATQVLQMIRQLAPLVRFDGYHILADLTGVPDLYARIKPTLLGLLPHRRGRAESRVLRPWARAVVTLWVLIVVPLLLLSLVWMVAVLPRLVATAWRSVRDQSTLLAAGWAEADAAAVGARLLSIVALSVPVLGMVYLLVRLVRRTVARVWRGTAGRPRLRLAAIAAGGAVIAALVWAWWPDGTRYRPIEEHERGTVTDVLLAEHSRPARPPVAGPAVEPLQAGDRRTVTTVVPRTARPPAGNRPRLALVLIPQEPRSRAGATPPPAWIFPFNPPEAPGEGDNQALAVNTRDGSTVYDIAFAMVWVDDGTVDNRNEAYALASCRDCRTVAVSFQVVVAVGRTGVVVPENVSVAVNHSCRECLTYALASQLVVTLPDGISAEDRRRLAEVWREVEAFGRRIQEFTPRQIQDRLERYKAEILAVIGYGSTATPTPPPSPSRTLSPTPSAAATPGPSGSPAPPEPSPPGPSPAGPSPTGPSPTEAPPSPGGTAPATPEPTPPETSAGATPPDPATEPEPSPTTTTDPAPEPSG